MLSRTCSRNLQISVQLGYAIESFMNRCQIKQRSQNRRSQLALAHRRLAKVQRMKQRRMPPRIRHQRLDQFQIAHGHGIELQTVAVLVIAHPIHVFQLAELRCAQIMHDAASRYGGCCVALQSKPRQFARPQMIFQQRNRIVPGQHPGFQMRHGAGAKGIFQAMQQRHRRFLPAEFQPG